MEHKKAKVPDALPSVQDAFAHRSRIVHKKGAKHRQERSNTCASLILLSNQTAGPTVQLCADCTFPKNGSMVIVRWDQNAGTIVTSETVIHD